MVTDIQIFHNLALCHLCNFTSQAILPILSYLFPMNKSIPRALFELSPMLITSGYVKKAVSFA